MNRPVCIDYFQVRTVPAKWYIIRSTRRGGAVSLKVKIWIIMTKQWWCRGFGRVASDVRVRWQA